MLYLSEFFLRYWLIGQNYKDYFRELGFMLFSLVMFVAVAVYVNQLAESLSLAAQILLASLPACGFMLVNGKRVIFFTKLLLDVPFWDVLMCGIAGYKLSNHKSMSTPFLICCARLVIVDPTMRLLPSSIHDFKNGFVSKRSCAVF